MKLFKNFQTKRQLREENAKLKEQIEWITSRPPTIQCERRTVRKIKASHLAECQEPEECVKDEIAYEILKEIKPYIDYKVFDNGNGEKTYTGTLEIVIKS